MAFEDWEYFVNVPVPVPVPEKGSKNSNDSIRWNFGHGHGHVHEVAPIRVRKAMPTLTLNSPAKLNLFLQVLRRRPDGYHDLASLMQTVSLYDRLHITLHSEDQLTCTDPSLPLDRTNLIIKAADLFRRKTGLQVHVKVHLEKNIPQHAGLGGGSSNAATTLWGLNYLSGQPATDQMLAEWSAEIGSDIPFFFSQGTAYCTGKGEHVRPVPFMPSASSLCIVKPKVGLPTPLVFKNLKLNSVNHPDPEDALRGFLRQQPHFFNDLEKPACALVPELKLLKEWLIQQGFSIAQMTGSGTSFFCLADRQVPMPSNVKNLSFFPVEFTQREPEEWY